MQGVNSGVEIGQECAESGYLKNKVADGTGEIL